MTQETTTIPEEFTKIMKDFISDILTTFPEYQPIISKWWSQGAPDSEEKVRKLFNYCIKVYPERFFDILYQKPELFQEDSSVNTEFLPGISFKYLWQCDISDKTRETMWKYLQMILICIVGCIRNKDAFGDTSKLFDAINEDEFKEKLEETLGNMQSIFENMAKNGNDNGDGDSNSNGGTDSGPTLNAPSADDIQDHIHSMMGGKLGDLAREIAEETSQNLNMDMDNVTDVKDIFQKLFSNPGKLMNLAKSVSEKLDTKMKSGDITENELMTEASEMLNKMKGMPGMGNIQDMLSKMGMNGMNGIPGMAGLGKNAKINVNAMQQNLEKTVKKEEFKEKMKKKMEKKAQEKKMEEINKIIQQTAQASSVPSLTDEELISIFSTGEKVERTPRDANSDKKKKKKNNK